MPTLEGSVENIVFRNEDNHYTVARFRPKDSGRLFRDDLMTIVGMLPGVHVGELLSVEGEWEKDPKYGRQLHVTNFVQRLPASVEGITRYLSSGLIKGIGPKKAKLIVEQFGIQTLAIMEQQPERLSEVKGIGAKDREQIIKTLAEQSEIIGFRIADDIAVKLGLPSDSVPRLATGLTYVLAQAANEDGHCFLPEGELFTRAANILQAPYDALPAALEQLRCEHNAFIEPPLPAQPVMRSEIDEEYPIDWSEVEEPEPQQRVYFAPFWYAEQGSARLLRILLHSPSGLPQR